MNSTTVVSMPGRGFSYYCLHMLVTGAISVLLATVRRTTERVVALVSKDVAVFNYVSVTIDDAHA